MSTIHVEHDLPGDPVAVFEWFVDPVLLPRWWPSEAETHAVEGGRYRLFWAGPDVTLRGEYRDVTPGERLEFTWSWDHEELPPRRVEVMFAPSDRGTLVSVTHECDSDDEGTGYVDGWTHFLSRLEARISDA
ncbi:MAG: SRPBCC domain-containing protein [Ilumatobacteraceae bacterium]|nr:SRPBCC domain-containing protein [Ilumatobacteraceae bacterium]